MRIRPILVEHCYECHSERAEKVRGGLMLDTREGLLRGGDNGPAFVARNPDQSLLIKAIRYVDPDTAMPPKKKGGKLSDLVIADFEKWIGMGAPDPRDGTLKAVKAWDPEAAKEWWSFQPLKIVSP
ncbi:MAG TPA: c-type cytochrome domain-containing protein, partial [Verrucomicrobiaceae bacterium]